MKPSMPLVKVSLSQAGYPYAILLWIVFGGGFTSI